MSHSFMVSTGLSVEVDNNGINKVGNDLVPKATCLPKPPPPYWVLSPLPCATALKQPRDGGPAPRHPRGHFFRRNFPKIPIGSTWRGLLGQCWGSLWPWDPMGLRCRQRGQGHRGCHGVCFPLGSLLSCLLQCLQQ